MAWLSGWSKRKVITLTGGADGSQVDFQLKLSIAYDSDMLSDFSDLRFTDADGTTLIDAWLEDKIDGTSADVYVEFPFTPADGVTETKGYMYYGKADAVSDWDGAATFAAYFDGDPTGWTEVDPNSHISFANGRLEFSGLARNEDAYVYKSFTLAEWVCEETYDITAGDSGGVIISPETSDVIDDLKGTSNTAYSQYYYGDYSYAGMKINNTGYSGPYQTIPAGTYYLRTTKQGDTITTDWYSDSTRETLAYSSTVTQSGLPSLSYLYMLNTYNDGDTNTISGWIDDFRVSKYAANPPTYEFGSEENAPSGLSMAVVMHHLRQMRRS